jgi:hypothetical protein
MKRLPTPFSCRHIQEKESEFMTRAFLRFGLLLAVIFGAPKVAQAQVILVGCTGNVTSTSGNSNIVDINMATGAATNPRDTGIFVLAGIATQPTTGQLFSLTTTVSTPANTLIRVNPNTGGVSVVGPTGLPNIVEGDLAFNPMNGFLYGLQDGGPIFAQRNFFQINPVTGAATVIANLPSADYSALAFNSSGTLYAIDSQGVGNSLLLTIDPNSGVITNTITMNVNLKSGVGMAFDPSTGIAYVADGGQESGLELLYTLNTGTGILSAIGPLGVPGGATGLAFINVPEPSSFCLLIFGAITFIARPVCRSMRFVAPR